MAILPENLSTSISLKVLSTSVSKQVILNTSAALTMFATEALIKAGVITQYTIPFELSSMLYFWQWDSGDYILWDSGDRMQING